MKQPVNKRKMQQSSAASKRMTKRVAIIIGIIVYLFLVFYILHFFIMQRETDLSFGKLFGAAWEDLLKQPFAILPLPMNGVLIILGMTVIGALLGIDMVKQAQLRKHYDPDTVNGDSKWLLDEFLEDYDRRFTEPFGEKGHDGKGNMILSHDMFMSLDNRGIGDHNNHNSRNANVFAVGGSGAGKTFGLVGPNIMQANCSYVITDPSGELFQNYGTFLERQGYRIKCFNLDHMEWGNHYNPLSYLETDKDIAVLVTTLITNTTPPDQKGGDPFWEKSEVALLNALIAYLVHYCEPIERNFSAVMELLRLAEVNENDDQAESPLDLLFKDIETIDENSYALKQYRTFKMGAGKTLKSILISVSVRLQSFDLEDVANLTDTDDIDLHSIGDERTALFVIIPTGEKTFNFLASMMYAQLFQMSYTYCENTAIFSQCVYDSNNELIRTFRANSEMESERVAKIKAEGFLEKARTATVEHNEEYSLYMIRARDGTCLCYRRTEEDANNALQALQNGYVKRLNKKRLPIHLRFLLDEFANTGKIPEFQEKVATIRKYEISVTIILQSLQQMKNLFENEWEAISGNCDNTIYLGGGADLTTTEWISKLIGKETRTVMNGSVKDGHMEMSYNRTGVELYTPEQLRTMPEDECIVLQKSLDPYRGLKFKATEHKNWKFCDGHERYVFNGERQANLYAEYIRAGEIGLEEADLNMTGHGTPVEDSPEESEVKDAKNKIGEEHAREIRDNMDADGNPIIGGPETAEAAPIAERMKVTESEHLKETETSLVEDNELDLYDDFEFGSMSAGD